MARESMGRAGLAAVIAGAACGAAAVFGEHAFEDHGLPYHFMNYAALSVLSLAAGVWCGARSWATRPGKAAVVLGAALGLAVAGYVALVLYAFSNPGR